VTHKRAATHTATHCNNSYAKWFTNALPFTNGSCNLYAVAQRIDCVLQCIAVCRSVLQLIFLYIYAEVQLIHSVLEYVEVCCRVLQCVAVDVPLFLCKGANDWLCVAVRWSMLQCVVLCCIECSIIHMSRRNWLTPCCSVLQCVAINVPLYVCRGATHRLDVQVCCCVWQFVAVWCSVFQCASAFCSVFPYM